MGAISRMHPVITSERGDSENYEDYGNTRNACLVVWLR